MEDAAKGNSNDRLFCWEQVNKTNPAFRISQVFVSRDIAEKLLPLYALFSIVEQISGHSSEEELVHSKLAWWKLECSPERLDQSRHPVLQELRRTVSPGNLNPQLINRLLIAAESRFEAEPPPDISDLEGRCERWAGLQLDLEMAVSGLLPGALEVPAATLVRSGLLQLLRENSGKKEQGAFSWVPLNLMAKHGVSRNDFVDQPGSEGVKALLRELIVHHQLPGPQLAVKIDATADFSGMRNYFAINGLYARKLKKLGKVPPNKHVAELSRVRTSDLLTAWRSARRFEC
jgi:phytoene synthase